MKHDCDIVRDLLPLCIDGTASEKTRNLVQQHADECAECRIIYAEMQRDASLVLPAAPDSAAFAETVKRIKQRRSRRQWMALLMGAVIALLTAGVVYGVYWQFFELVPLQVSHRVTLHTTADGSSFIRLDGVPEETQMHILVQPDLQYSGGEMPLQAVIHLYCTRQQLAAPRTVYDLYLGRRTENGVAIENRFEPVEVQRIALAERFGLIYLAGLDEKLSEMPHVTIRSADRVEVIQVGNRIVHQPDSAAPRP